MKTKTIIISQPEGSGRGILTLYIEDDLLKTKIRLYEVKPLSAYCKLGIYHNNEVYTANLICKSGVYTTSFVGNFNLDADFYCAIINPNNNNEVILSGGTYAGYFFEDNSVFEPKNEESSQERTVSESEIYKNKTTHSVKGNEAQSSVVNNFKTEECIDCAHCKYKEYFYASNPLSNNPEEENYLYPNSSKNLSNQTKQTEIKQKNVFFTTNNIENVQSIKTQNSFYQNQNETHENADENQQANPKTDETSPAHSLLESLIPQFDYIFKNYPENIELDSLIENAKFVSIDDNNENYSIGAIYEDNKMKYICYAVRCNYNSPAPEELGKFYQWLPVDQSDPLSEGYYIVYQDATDLKILEI